MIHKSLMILAIGLITTAAQAYDFSEANAHFEKRENSFENVQKAMDLYSKAKNRVRGEELVYAVEQLGRLAYYWGDMVLDEDSPERLSIFTKCMDDVEAISPDNLGSKHPAYYYWKATCFGFWGKAAGQWDALPKIGEFKDALVAGIKLDASKTYEGGGIYRVAGATYIKSKKMALLGLYDPVKAWKLTNYAISKGPEFYSVYLIKAEILKEQGKTDEAQKLLEQLRDLLQRKLDKGELEGGNGPENKVYLERSKKLLKQWFDA